MICFIAARDKEEFEKYKAGSHESDSYLDIYQDDKSLMASVIFRILTSANGQVSPLFVVLDGEKNNCKNHMDASHSKDLLAHMVNIFVRAHTELANGHVRNAVQDNIVGCLEKSIKVNHIEARSVTITRNGKPATKQIPSSTKKLIIDDAVIFIHWGGGAPRTYENNFSQLLVEYLKSSDSQFTRSVRAYAFSSRRAELFDVTKSKIEFPTTIEEVKALEDKFRGAKNIVDAKKIMTEYVLAAHNAGDEINLTNTEGDVFGDAVQEVVGEMGKEWGSGYLEEDEQSRRAGLIAHYEQCKMSNERGVSDKELTKLFKIILEEEAQNG